MTEFQLTIELTAADTKKVNEEGLQVALVKGLGADESSNLIWISFALFEANLVSWHDVYGLFGSPDPVQPETVITASSIQLPARPGIVYPFENGVFGTPPGGSPSSQYFVQNREPRTLTFGLAQSVAGGGKNLVGSPVNAFPLPSQEEIAITPSETVFVFLRKEIEAGTVTIVTHSDALKVSFSAANPKQTIHYDATSKSFVPGPVS